MSKVTKVVVHGKLTFLFPSSRCRGGNDSFPVYLLPVAISVYTQMYGYKTKAFLLTHHSVDWQFGRGSSGLSSSYWPGYYFQGLVTVLGD